MKVCAFVIAMMLLACSSSSSEEKKPLCCSPSPAPGCCMRLGGVSYDGVCPLTCDIPDPNAAGWQLVTDADGCRAWQRPIAPFACIPEAGASDAPSDTLQDVADGALDICEPESVASYTPTPLNPPRTPSNSCSSTELDQLYVACFGPNVTTTSCETFLTAQTTCAQCLLSNVKDATWGPLVDVNGYYWINVGGCVDILQNDSSATSCGARLEASWGCQGTACASCYDEPEIVLAECYQQAAANECRTYTDAECSPGDGGFAQCLIADGTKASVISFASVFCGP